MKSFRVLCWLLLAASLAAAAEFRGTITDYSNGRPVAGAQIGLSGTTFTATSDDRGRFVIVGVGVGDYVVRVTHGRFNPFSYELNVPTDDARLSREISLKPAVPGQTTERYMLGQPRYLMDEVTVTTNRADADHPVTFANITRETVDRASYGQDIPMLFSEQPNLYTYSDGGNGFGYSYIRMRGFSQNRIAVQLNGVPLNDAESHEVFWVDLPDFAEDVEDVQIQRGVGSSLYGAASLGGSINLVTKTPGLGYQPKLRAEGMYGTWNTRRASVMFESGRINGRYGLAGRLTRMESNGYRFGSWLKTWSYYLSAARFTPAHTTKLVFYGGPEKTHLAYNGVTRDYLEGLVTGNRDEDRRYNPLTHPDEIDNFFQPHYELHDEWRLGEDLKLENSFYVFRGDGYYDQWKTGRKFAEYFLSPGQETVTVTDPAEFPAYYYETGEDDEPQPDTLGNGSIVYTLKRTDLLRRRNISEMDGGWIPRLTIDHRYGRTIVGGETRMHHGRHEGMVRWARVTPSDAIANQHYYDYKVDKQSFSGYIHNLFIVTDRLRAMLDLQAQTHRYELTEDPLFHVEFDESFTSVNPRAGLSYRLVDPDPDRSIPLGVIYGSVSWAQREPAFRDLYNAQDYSQSPKVIPSRFAGGEAGGEYIGPSLDPERLVNIETGMNWQWVRARLGVNYYHMSLTDAIVTENGQLDDLGNLLSANADEALHQGVEIMGAVQPLDFLSVSANLALTDHSFVRYDEVDWVTWELTSRDGNRLGQDPVFVANGQVDFEYESFFGGVGFRSVGKQFTDNSENDETAIDPYTLVNLDFGYRLRDLPGAVPLIEFRLRVNNLFDTEYESVGYGDSYIVGAPRAVYSTLAVEL